MNIPVVRRTWLLLLVVGLGVILALAACDDDSSPSTSANVTPTVPDSAAAAGEGPIELVVWAEWNTQDTMITDPDGAGRYGKYIKEQFEREHPGVTVRIEYQGWDEALRQNLFNALLAGTPPDVVVGENYFQFFAELGALVPLDDRLADELDNLIPGTYRAAEYQGSIYGVSAFTGVFSLERNCTVIEQAGLDCDAPPQSWDELLAQVQTITEQGAGDYYGYTLQGPGGTSVGAVFRLAVFLAQLDAALCEDPDCTYPYFNNPRAVPVMEFIRALNQSTPPGLTFNPHEGQVYEAMYQGLTAYQIGGSWHPGWAVSAGCEDCRYSAVPVPADGHPASVVVGNVIYAALQQGRHPELGAEFVEFLVRDDVQNMVYPALGRLPSTRSALTALRATVDPATQTFIDELLNNPTLTILPQWRKDPQALWSIYNDMLHDVLATDRPVEEIMNEAQAAADGVMQQ